MSYFIEPEPVKQIPTNSNRDLNAAVYALKVTLYPDEDNEVNIGYKGATLLSFTPKTLTI